MAPPNNESLTKYRLQIEVDDKLPPPKVVKSDTAGLPHQQRIKFQILNPLPTTGAEINLLETSDRAPSSSVIP